MGDRGGTATYGQRSGVRANYTRWEIGGEPQLAEEVGAEITNYTRWEIGGEPQHTA